MHCSATMSLTLLRVFFSLATSTPLWKSGSMKTALWNLPELDTLMTQEVMQLLTPAPRLGGVQLCASTLSEVAQLTAGSRTCVWKVKSLNAHTTISSQQPQAVHWG